MLALKYRGVKKCRHQCCRVSRHCFPKSRPLSRFCQQYNSTELLSFHIRRSKFNYDCRRLYKTHIYTVVDSKSSSSFPVHLHSYIQFKLVDTKISLVDLFIIYQRNGHTVSRPYLEVPNKIKQSQVYEVC